MSISCRVTIRWRHACRIIVLAGATAIAPLASAAPPANALSLPATGGSITLTPPPPPVPVNPAPVLKLSPKQAEQLVAMLHGAFAQGIVSTAPLPDPGTDLSAADNASLIAAALAYARAVHTGQLAPAQFLPEWGMRPAPYDPQPTFYDAITRGKLADWSASLPPPYEGYEGLRRGLARYRAIAAAGGWTPLTPGDNLALGAKGRQVAELRARLRIEDPEVDASSSDTFDQPLLEAVRRAQRRYGIEPTGTVARQTRAALDTPVDVRIRQIIANMERWRWLPQNLAHDRIQVNIAAAVLTMFEGDTPVMSMRAVTGRPGDETPMLQSTIHSIVLNPPWNVPTSIAKRELWPKEHAHPGYLRRNGFKVIKLADGGTRLQQAAGTQSALGRFKFDFDNPYAVYLHDTPSRGTFSRYDRLASHGCVRLEKPADLAALLLQGNPGWSADAIAEATSVTDTQRVRLQNPVAVYLLYWTAFASANGQMNFRADPYGWDALLATKIGAEAQAPQLTSR